MTPIKYDLHNIPLPVALAVVKAFTGNNQAALAQQYCMGIKTVYQLLALAEQGISATAAAPLLTAWENQTPLAAFHHSQLGCLSGILQLLHTVQRHQETGHPGFYVALLPLSATTAAAGVQANSPAVSAHTPAMPLQDDHTQQDSGQSFSSPLIDPLAE